MATRVTMAVANPVEPSVMESRKPSTRCKMRMPKEQTTRKSGGDAWTADQSARDAASTVLRKDWMHAPHEPAAAATFATAEERFKSPATIVGADTEAVEGAAAADAADAGEVALTVLGGSERPLVLEALAASNASAMALLVALLTSRALRMKIKASLDHDRYMNRKSATMGPRQRATMEQAR